MHRFLEFFFLGLTNGAIYASLSLSIVILMQTMRLPNFSQGESATFSTLFGSFLIVSGVPALLAVPMTLVFAFCWGLLLHRLFYKPVEHAGASSQLLVLIGLFLGINGLSGILYGGGVHYFPYPFPKADHLFDNDYLSNNQLFVLVVISGLIAGFTYFYRYTKLGLALRALAQNPVSCSLMGINSSRMLMINWGVAAVIAAVAGMLVAPIVSLNYNMMSGILIYAFAGCLLGGIYSPFGAVFGAISISIMNTMVFFYFGWLDRSLEMLLTFSVIVVVLIFKPGGLFSRKTISRM